MRAVVIRQASNGDGTTDVQVGTSRYGQATVVVPDDSLGHPDLQVLYDHVANLDRTAYTVRRVSRRDQLNHGG